MNKVILAAVAGLATVASVSAQGTLSINSATGTKPRITLDGVNAAPGDNIFVQVLIAGATSLTGAAAEPFALTLSGGNAGLFSKGVLTIGGKAGGSTVDVTINAWDKDTGATYADATLKGSQTFSAVLGGAGDPPGPPNGIVGQGLFSGLALVTPVIPEPSTYALAALGLGGLLFLRRK